MERRKHARFHRTANINGKTRVQYLKHLVSCESREGSWMWGRTKGYILNMLCERKNINTTLDEN